PLLVTLSAVVLLPAAAQARTHRVALRGVVQIPHADYFKSGIFRERVQLQTSHGTVPLALNAANYRDLAGSRIRVRGVRRHGALDVLRHGIRLLRGQRRSLSMAETGTKKLLVLLLNFKNDRSQPWTTDDVKNVVFNNTDSVAAYYKEESSGQVQLTGDVRGWFQLNDDNTNCNYGTWQNDADAAAKQAGVDLSAYTFHMYVW